MELKQIICNDQSANSCYQLFMGDMLKSYYNKCGINEPKGRRVRACFHGWVILSNHPDPSSVTWSLWNPSTSELINLPPWFDSSHACCLSSPPGDQRSVFLLLSDKIPDIVFCRLDRERKGLKWSKMSYAKQIRSISGVDDRLLECPTCCNGKVYAMTLEPNYRYVIEVGIVVKDKEVVISLKPVVKVPNAPDFSFHTIYSFLKGHGTQLFYIEISFKDELTNIVEARLFKLDMTGMMWEEMEDLKDATFFLELSSYSAFYKSAVASHIGGCIHVLGQRNKIISFHVKDRTMSLSPMECIARESQVLVWAMLECRLLEANCHEAKHEKDTEVVIRSVNRDETEFDNTRSESRLLNVPFHILQMISECCSRDEIQSFRATCKCCYLATPLWRPQMYSPWFLVLDNYRGTLIFIDPICSKKYFKKVPLELKSDCQCEILCSKYGWLLISKFLGRELVFFNPFIGKIRKLPKTPHDFRSICFSAPPTSPDCMVVGFTTHEPFHVYIHFVSRKPPSWQKYRLDFGTNDPYSFHLPTFSGRDIYALCNNERIVAFRDIGKEDFSWKVVKDNAPTSCCKPRSKLYLSKCDQHLLLVIVSEFGESVEVFKLNDSTKEWEKIDSLGTHMVYISESSCICLEAKLPQMRNKIYFPRLLRKSQVFYSLETCRYHTFDDKIIQESFGVNLLGTRHHWSPHTWIEYGWF